MKLKLFFFVLLLVDIVLVYSQDTTFIYKFAKNYGYKVELYKGENNYIASYDERKKVLYIALTDTVEIWLMDTRTEKVFPFELPDSAEVVVGIALGIPRTIMSLKVTPNGSIRFCPSFIPNYQDYLSKGIVIPCRRTMEVADFEDNPDKKAAQILNRFYTRNPDAYSVGLVMNWEMSKTAKK